MSGLEEIDWETVVDVAKRVGGLLLALLFALAARRKRRAASREESEPEPGGEEVHEEVREPWREEIREPVPFGPRAIRPGDDASKMAKRYSGSDSD